MPTASRECVRLISSWSPSWRSTIAVEDIASAPPITMAGATVRCRTPRRCRRTPRSSSSICRPPTPSTSDFIATMRAQRELEPEREHQEHDADLGQQPHGLVVRREPERVRAEHHADDEVAEDRRQREAPHQAEHQQRARQQDQDLARESRRAIGPHRPRCSMLAFRHGDARPAGKSAMSCRGQCAIAGALRSATNAD